VEADGSVVVETLAAEARDVEVPDVEVVVGVAGAVVVVVDFIRQLSPICCCCVIE